MEFKTSPKRPYLLRAYYDWLVDNNLTPYLVVNANYYGVNVPQEYVRDGQIVLNLSPAAVGNLALGNDAIEFNARFQGMPRDLYIPLGAAIALYARENGDGVMFEADPIYDEMDNPKSEQKPTLSKSTVSKAESSATKKTDAKSDKKSTKPASHLRIVK